VEGAQQPKVTVEEEWHMDVQRWWQII